MSGVPTPPIVHVRIDRRHPLGSFVPERAIGAGVDGMQQGDCARVYVPKTIAAMRAAGLRPLTYRLRTELGIEAWHWNPAGRWSQPGTNSGYWTSSPTPSPSPNARLTESYGYRLPRRGSTIDQANNDGFSRIDDGDLSTFWKSNPYLDRRWTGEPNAAHPQWIVVDLGRPTPVDAVRVRWGAPFATRFRVDYWRPNPGDPQESIDDTFEDSGAWHVFPTGRVRQKTAVDAAHRLAEKPFPVRFVRVWMSASSGGGPRTGDPRDGVGYAIREIEVGTLDRTGLLRDRVRHAPDNVRQTRIFASSTDPWHRAADRDGRTEQPGFDRVAASGLTHGQPMLTPVAVLYDTPANAAAELRWLRARRISVTRIELGEEPDGQYVTPEDYGALYIQFADALHAVDPRVALGGPSLQTTVTGWTAWPDARRHDRAWMRRFLRYLRARKHARDFAFFSFEWYPFNDVSAAPAPLLESGPELLDRTLDRLYEEGLPRHLPTLITEYGYSSSAGQPEVELPGALLNAEIVARFLTRGGTAAYFYGYEPGGLSFDRAPRGEGSWGSLSMLLGDGRGLFPTSVFHGAALLTHDWTDPAASDRPHRLLRARTDAPALAAYALRRPDRRIAVLLLNRDPNRTLRVRTDLIGPLETTQFGPDQYVWRADGPNGHPDPNRPPDRRRLPPNAAITLPPFSITVVRGK